MTVHGRMGTLGLAEEEKDDDGSKPLFPPNTTMRIETQ